MEFKDLIIAFAGGYTREHLMPWVKSLREDTDFDGDVVIVTNEMTKDTYDYLTNAGIIVASYGDKNEDGDIVKKESNTPPHVLRFFYLWDYLCKTEETYRYILTTDVRDVIFQKNPSEYMSNSLIFHTFLAATEGMRYKNEPWGRNNLIQSYGIYFYEQLKENYIYNVGILAGETESMKGLLLLILQMSTNRAIPIVDQASYNVIINNPMIELDIFKTTHSDAWAVNLGTSIEAVKAGSGDLGQAFVSDIYGYNAIYEEEQPKIEDGIVKNAQGQPFVIVHQWDRIPALKRIVEKKYGI